MSQKMKINLFLGCAIGCWLLIALWAMVTHQQGSAVDPIYDSIHGDIYATNETVSLYQNELLQGLANVSGALLPNPQNNSEAMAELMANLSKSLDAKAILMVAFDENIGATPFTGDWGWQTPYGIIQTDKGRIDALKSAGFKVDNDVLDGVDDLGIAMFYCGYYLRGIPVVPVVLDESLSQSQIKESMAAVDLSLKDIAVLVIPPECTEEPPLITSDLQALQELLNSGASTDFSGIFSKEDVLGLTAFYALVSKEENTLFVDCIHNETRSPQKFSDLMIYSIK